VAGTRIPRDGARHLAAAPASPQDAPRAHRCRGTPGNAPGPHLRVLVGTAALISSTRPAAARVVAQFESSPKPAEQVLVSASEHPADCPLNDRVGHPESRFDLYIVADGAATGIVEQSALVPPDAVPPTGRGFTKASLVWQSDQLNAVSIDWNEAQPKLPKHGSTDLPRFGIEACTVSWVGHSEERRDLPVDAANGRHRGPDL
jgi:hypothetical protein